MNIGQGIFISISLTSLNILTQREILAKGKTNILKAVFGKIILIQR